MRVLDLFAGIGGFSLAAHWMGWHTEAFVEKDKFCQQVLRKNFGQDIEIHDDILTFSGKPFRGRVDIVTGGFPCQPFSAAGKRKGRDDERHLFPSMLRVISEVRPRWVVAENVRGLLSIESGSVFSEVVSSLEGEGYEVITFCVPASAVEAPHRRDRLWFVARNSDSGQLARIPNGDFQEEQNTNAERSDDVANSNDGEHPNARERYRPTYPESSDTNQFSTINSISESAEVGKSRTVESSNGEAERTRRTDILNTLAYSGSNATDPNGERCIRRSEQGQDRERAVQTGCGSGRSFSQSSIGRGNASKSGDSRLQGSKLSETFSEKAGTSRPITERLGDVWRENWLDVATRTCVRRVDDGLLGELDIAGSRDNRVARLKALGNAIVPQVALEIFRAIEASEKEGI